MKAAKPIRFAELKRILVINLAFIGDVILTTPAIRAVKEACPGAAITMLTVPLTAEVAEMNPFVDDVMMYDKKGKDKGLLGMFSVGRRLRRRNFDMAICMNFATRGAIVAFLAGIKIRLGYDVQHAGFFLTHKASAIRTTVQHETINHFGVLVPLGFATRNLSLVCEPPERAKRSFAQKAEKLALLACEYIAICPFGRHERRNLSEETVSGFLREFFADADAAKNRKVYLIGGKNDAQGLEVIARSIGNNRVQVVAGTLTLQELALFLEKADLLVTVDTGPAHIAQAVHCPTLDIFSTGDPRVWGPRGEYDIVIAEERDAETGLLPETDCIRSIPPERILQSVKWILQQSMQKQ